MAFGNKSKQHEICVRYVLRRQDRSAQTVSNSVIYAGGKAFENLRKNWKAIQKDNKSMHNNAYIAFISLRASTKEQNKHSVTLSTCP